MIRTLTTALWTAGACTLAAAQAGAVDARTSPPLPVAPFTGASGIGPAVAALPAAPPAPPVASPAASPAAPVHDAPAAAGQRWEVKASDVTLAKTLERWAAAAGHKLKWDASRNFLIGAPDLYVGTFEDALQHLLHSPGIRFSDYPLEACVYANTPPLVRITRLGEQVRECVAVPAL